MSDGHAYDCPQCGEPTETLHEGYCEDCCRDNQAALDAHNRAFDRWEKMSDNERARAIAKAAGLFLLGE